MSAKYSKYLELHPHLALFFAAPQEIEEHDTTTDARNPWIATVFKNRGAEKAIQRLSKRHINTYYPYCRTAGGYRKPMWGNYLLVQLPDEELNFSLLTKDENFIHIITDDSGAIKIRNKFVDRHRIDCQNGAFDLHIKQRPEYANGDVLVVGAGALEGKSVQILENIPSFAPLNLKVKVLFGSLLVHIKLKDLFHVESVIS